jgi:hypothetical protein
MRQPRQPSQPTLPLPISVAHVELVGQNAMREDRDG